MRARKKFLPYLFFGLFLFGLWDLWIFLVDPYKNISFGPLSFSPIIIFLMLFFFSFSSLLTFLFLNRRRGFLGGVLLLSVLVFRLYGLKNLMYVVILLGVVILLELLLARIKKSR